MLPLRPTRSLSRCVARELARLPSTAKRTFSSTPAASKTAPESPRYIDVPQTPQQSYPSRRRVKGVLPVPRELFPRRRPDKGTTQYLDAVTPEPQQQGHVQDAAAGSEATDFVGWKRRLASKRRENLRDSLVELRERKRHSDWSVARRGEKRSAEREARVHRPMREDDRLTTPTITTAMKMMQIGAAPDPDREARLAEKTARIQAQEREEKEHRQDALHTLYMHARDFITTEAQLSDEVERVFKPIAIEWAGDAAGDNIWNTGSPETVQDLLNSVNKMDDKAIRRHESYARQSHERVLRVAEELTGGKI